MLILERVLHITWNNAFIDAEYLRDYYREGKLGQKNFQQQLRHVRNKFVFRFLLHCSDSNRLSFTLFARESGFTAIAVLLVVEVCKGPIFSGSARPVRHKARPVFVSSIVGPAR
jgi:hypothetical protein